MGWVYAIFGNIAALRKLTLGGLSYGCHKNVI